MREYSISSKPSNATRILDIVEAKLIAWPSKTISAAEVVRMFSEVPPPSIEPKLPTAKRLRGEDLAQRHQAYRAVKRAIRCGELPSPSSCVCADGDHPATEYDHHISYEPEHYLSVEPVCRSCHQRRNSLRGQYKAKGRYKLVASSVEEAVLAFDMTGPA